MPLAPTPTVRRPPVPKREPPIPKREPQVDPLEEALAEFLNDRAWRRNAKGNLVRRWERTYVSIFRRRGEFGFALIEDLGTAFSDETYDSERYAIEAAFYALQDPK